MTYPSGPPWQGQPQPQQPYQGQPQPGYQQPPPAYQQPPAGPPAGYYPQSTTQPEAFDFGALYASSDHSGGLIPEEWYPAVVTESEFAPTKAGDKWGWTIKVQLTHPQYMGRNMTTNVTISPRKTTGEPNPKGLGWTFRQLRSLGVPVGPPVGPATEQPFWAQFPVPPNASPQQQYEAIRAAGLYAASLMVGRPVRVHVYHDEYEGRTRSKINDFADAKPGDPTQVTQQPTGQPGYPQQAPQAGPGSMMPQMAPPPMPAPQYPQPGAQPVQQQPAAAPPQQYAPPQPPATAAPAQPYPGQPTAPGPWQQPTQAPPAPAQPQQWQTPAGQPAMPPPQDPGQPGMGQFAPPANGAPAQPQQQPPGQGAPPLPPWAQQPPQ